MTGAPRAHDLLRRFGSFAVAGSALAMTMVCAAIERTHLTFVGSALVFSATAFSYALDKWIDPRDGSVRYRSGALVAGMIWASVAVAAVHGGLALATLFSAAFPASVWMYSREPRLSGARRRIKDSGWVKSTYVALCWSALALFPPVLAPDATISPRHVACAVLWTFAISFVQTAASDLCDVAKDLGNGVRTLPILLGRANALNTLQCINAAGVAATAALAVTSHDPSLYALEIVVLYLAACLEALRSRRWSAAFVTHVMLDAVIAPCLLLASLLVHR